MTYLQLNGPGLYVQQLEMGDLISVVILKVDLYPMCSTEDLPS